MIQFEYPLRWPSAIRRTCQCDRRKYESLQLKTREWELCSYAKVCLAIDDAIAKLSLDTIVVTSNVLLGPANAIEEIISPVDPGVVVYWKDASGSNCVIPCDTGFSVFENALAILDCVTWIL